MKVITGAVLLALSGAAYAVPLPIGVIDNVQDNCSGMGPGCVSAGPFLHHLADSETKYLHLVHPETGDVMHVIAPSSSLAASSSSASGTNDDEVPGKPAAGVYPNSNHPATSTPFTDPPSIFSSNSSSLASSTSGSGSNSKPTSLTDDSSSSIKPQDDDKLEKPSPVRPAGMAVAPNSTLADQLLTKGSAAPLPGVASAANQTNAGSPAANSSPAPAIGDTKKANSPPSDTPANSTKVADATGVAQAPNLLKINDGSPDQKMRERK